MQRTLAASPPEAGRWAKLRLVAIDKVTLALPEYPALWRRFGSHTTSKGLTTISVELVCAFHVGCRLPFAYCFDRACSSEHQLLCRLLGGLKKGDLVLIDNGFYSLEAFTQLRRRGCHFLCPMTTAGRPRVKRKLGEGDYLCEITSIDRRTRVKRTLTVRVIYACAPGFRRRRLVTSLLDPLAYPAAELAAIYHQRWHIETFYRDFKSTMRANRWHCQSPDTFAKELAVKMILVCLVRRAMLAAAGRHQLPVGQLSFSAALTATNAFLAHLLRSSPDDFARLYDRFVDACGRSRVRQRPGRAYSRDKQTYRRRSRGMIKKKRGRPPKAPSLPPPDPSMAFTLRNGTTELLP